MMSWCRCWCCELAKENIISLWTAVNNNNHNHNNHHHHRTSARAIHAGELIFYPSRNGHAVRGSTRRRQNLAEIFFFCMARLETWTSSKPMTKLFILGGPDTRDLLLLGIHHRHTIRFSHASHSSSLDEWTLTQIRPQPIRESPQSP
jgi:hypothetical protein